MSTRPPHPTPLRTTMGPHLNDNAPGTPSLGMTAKKNAAAANAIDTSLGGLGGGGAGGATSTHVTQALMEALQSDSVQPANETTVLEAFITEYSTNYEFKGQEFDNLFHVVVKNRMLNNWSSLHDTGNDESAARHQLRILQCVRVLMRSPRFQKEFASLDQGLTFLAGIFHVFSEAHFQEPPGVHNAEILAELTSMFKKLADDPSTRDLVIDSGAQRSLILLLSSMDATILQCTLLALINLCIVAKNCVKIGQLECISTLLRILQDYELAFKCLSAELLRLLAVDEDNRMEMALREGIAVCLSLLHSDNVYELEQVVNIITDLALDQESRKDIRQLGGIPVLISLAATPNPDASPSFVISVCTALMQLSMDDENSYQFRQFNGVYMFGRMLIDKHWTEVSDKAPSAGLNVHAHVFRTLRFVFSVERNRKTFKKLFPPDLFAAFIDVRHYVTSINVYMPLVEKLKSLTAHQKDLMEQRLEEINITKGPTRYIREYAVVEILGSGAFGKVYQVQKDNSETVYALKELPLNTLTDKENKSDELESSIGEMTSEVDIINKLEHPNIVRYYKSFVEDDCLYILMEKVDGSSLSDRVNSLAVKNTHFPEDVLWHIMLQLAMALQYIHKEKKIVHRDLTPNNILIDAQNNVKIADFGLARQKRTEMSVMTSVVGTILYACPEIIQHEAYTEKADVWSLGCVLYQMATLKPPFSGSNPISVARKIVEADYEPMNIPHYSPLVGEVVKKLLTTDPNQRPDMNEVASLLAPRLMIHLHQQDNRIRDLQMQVDMEREKRQRHYFEAHRTKEAYHRLLTSTSTDGKDRVSSGTPRSARGRGHGFGSSAAPMLSISPAKVRQINDPTTQILNQLHKLLFITQKPPGLERDRRRHIIDKFKRSLFAYRSRSFNLKNELNKLISGSQDVIDTDVAPGGGDTPRGRRDSDSGQRVTYEDLQRMVEETLHEYGYYDQASATPTTARPGTTPSRLPFSPHYPSSATANKSRDSSASSNNAGGGGGVDRGGTIISPRDSVPLSAMMGPGSGGNTPTSETAPGSARSTTGPVGRPPSGAQSPARKTPSNSSLVDPSDPAVVASPLPPPAPRPRSGSPTPQQTPHPPTSSNPATKSPSPAPPGGRSPNRGPSPRRRRSLSQSEMDPIPAYGSPVPTPGHLADPLPHGSGSVGHGNGNGGAANVHSNGHTAAGNGESSLFPDTSNSNGHGPSPRNARRNSETSLPAIVKSPSIGNVIATANVQAKEDARKVKQGGNIRPGPKRRSAASAGSRPAKLYSTTHHGGHSTNTGHGNAGAAGAGPAAAHGDGRTSPVPMLNITGHEITPPGQ